MTANVSIYNEPFYNEAIKITMEVEVMDAIEEYAKDMGYEITYQSDTSVCIQNTKVIDDREVHRYGQIYKKSFVFNNRVVRKLIYQHDNKIEYIHDNIISLRHLRNRINGQFKKIFAIVDLEFFNKRGTLIS